jgi:hypothetical protein
VSSLHQAHQFLGWDHGYRPFAFAANDHDFTVIGHAVEHGR